MPSSAGTGLWLPDDGGLVLYLTLVSTCEEPSIGGLSRTQPAALAAVSRSDSTSFGILAPPLVVGAFTSLLALLSSPPPLTSRTTTTTTAIVSSAPSRNCRLRVRFWDAACDASAASRSSRRRRFSSSLLAMGTAGYESASGCATPRRRPLRAPALVDEARDLVGQPLGRDAQLEDRIGL